VDARTKILDVGCGHGDFMAPIYRKTELTWGIDPDESALARNEIIRNTVPGRAEDMPFADDAFDLVVSAWTFEHLEDPPKALQEVHRVLKPGGKLVFLTPNLRNYNVWIIRLVPERFHDFFTRKLYGRGEHDTFRKFYRVNFVPQIDETFRRTGFKKINLMLNGDPSYISFNEPLFRLACLLERVLDKWFESAKVHLIGIYEK